MKKEKNLSYYRNLLHKDGIALLVVAVIFTIVSFLFMLQDGYSGDLSVPIFLKSIMFIVLSAILVCNKKETKKFIGILTIIISCLMLLTSIGDGSLFGIVYFLLGIFLGIHSILYLIKFKNYNVQSNYSDEIVVKNSKMKYLSLMPIIISIILAIVGIVFGQSLIGISWCSIAILVINIANIIFCIILHNKRVKSALMYVMLAMSIMITLFSSLFLIDDIGHIIRKNQKYNSIEYIFDKCENAENEVEKKITLLENLTALKVNIGENAIISLDDYLNLDTLYSIDVINLKELKDDGYTCDGYIVLKWNNNLDIDSYYDVTDKLSYPYNMKDYFSTVKTYIRCTGKYNYQTDDFDDTKLPN